MKIYFRQSLKTVQGIISCRSEEERVRRENRGSRHSKSITFTYVLKDIPKQIRRIGTMIPEFTKGEEV